MILKYSKLENVFIEIEIMNEPMLVLDAMMLILLYSLRKTTDGMYAVCGTKLQQCL